MFKNMQAIFLGYHRNTFSMKMCFFGEERMRKKRFERDETSGLVSFRQLRKAEL